MIRRDLFAVKVYGDGGWCYERITRKTHVAKNYRAIVKANNHRHFPLVEPQIVHPSQAVVAAFVAAGNDIN